MEDIPPAPPPSTPPPIPEESIAPTPSLFPLPNPPLILEETENVLPVPLKEAKEEVEVEEVEVVEGAGGEEMVIDSGSGYEVVEGEFSGDDVAEAVGMVAVVGDIEGLGRMGGLTEDAVEEVEVGVDADAQLALPPPVHELALALPALPLLPTEVSVHHLHANLSEWSKTGRNALQWGFFVGVEDLANRYSKVQKHYRCIRCIPEGRSVPERGQNLKGFVVYSTANGTAAMLNHCKNQHPEALAALQEVDALSPARTLRPIRTRKRRKMQPPQLTVAAPLPCPQLMHIPYTLYRSKSLPLPLPEPAGVGMSGGVGSGSGDGEVRVAGGGGEEEAEVQAAGQRYADSIQGMVLDQVLNREAEGGEGEEQGPPGGRWKKEGGERAAPEVQLWHPAPDETVYRAGKQVRVRYVAERVLMGDVEQTLRLFSNLREWSSTGRQALQWGFFVGVEEGGEEGANAYNKEHKQYRCIVCLPDPTPAPKRGQTLKGFVSYTSSNGTTAMLNHCRHQHCGAWADLSQLLNRADPKTTLDVSYLWKGGVKREEEVQVEVEVEVEVEEGGAEEGVKLMHLVEGDT